ncbi:MAG: hypothetical protein QME47_07595 [Candidatus Thermoplasmatota archaeon]|nr:hypothetical protein [Candidatus Thermoplasmatota archaeon]
MHELQNPIEWLGSQKIKPKDMANTHVLWEKTVGKKRFAVCAVFDPVYDVYAPSPFTIVYEERKVKHAFFQELGDLKNAYRALIYTENFEKFDPPVYEKFIEKRSNEFLYFYFLTRMFMDGSLLFSFPTDDPKKEARWAKHPDKGLPAKYVIYNTFSYFLACVKYSVNLEEELKDLTGRVSEKLLTCIENYVYTGKHKPKDLEDLVALTNQAFFERGYLYGSPKFVEEYLPKYLLQRLKFWYDMLELAEKEQEGEAPCLK